MWKLPDGRDWLWGNLGLALMGKAMLSKSLIQFSFDVWGCVLSLCLAEGGDRLQKGLCQPPCGSQDCYIQHPGPCGRPHLCQRLLDTQSSLAQPLAGSLLLSPGSWCTQTFVCALQASVSPDLWKFCNQIPLAFKVRFPGGSQSLCLIPRLGNLLWALERKGFFGIMFSSLWVVCPVALRRG